MNERIRELAWSIGIAGKNPQGQIETDWDHLEKFAELIIRECIAVHVDDYGYDLIGYVIKKHFGVEETP